MAQAVPFPVRALHGRLASGRHQSWAYLLATTVGPLSCDRLSAGKIAGTTCLPHGVICSRPIAQQGDCMAAESSGASASSELDVPSTWWAVVERAWPLSRTAHGSRLVQQALDVVDENGRISIANKFQGHVLEGSRCPHANFVLQKFVQVLYPPSLQWLLDEILEHATQTACHRFGCRIMERLLEHWPAEQMQAIVERLLLEAPLLCQHTYGNFVMQHAMKYGTEAQQEQLAHAVTLRVADMAHHHHACAVVSKALTHGPESAREALAGAIVERKLVVNLACTRHGHHVAKQTLLAADSMVRDTALAQLRDGLDALMNTRYGRQAVKELAKDLRPNGK